MQEVRLKIDSYEDRDDIVCILARNGYKVWIQKINNSNSIAKLYEFWVIFEVPEANVKEVATREEE